MKKIVLSIFAIISILSSFAQSDIADRMPLITNYKGDNGSELFIWSTEMTVKGYYKKDKVDSISMGSFLPDYVSLNLKSGNQIDGKYKSLESFKSKVLDSDFKKIDKIEFTRAPKADYEIDAQAIDQDKFVAESGIATYNIDGTDQMIFALYYEFRDDAGSHHGYDGIADKIKEEGDEMHYRYTFFEADDPESNMSMMNTYINFTINKTTKEITFWVDSQASSSLMGLKQNEKIKCKAK